MGQLEGRVSFITGAGSGIGLGAARRLAREGSLIACVGRKEPEVDRICEEISAAGGRAMSVVADISSPEDMQEAVRQVVEAWGRIDVVFANAGINGVWAPLEDLTPEDWDKTLGVNLKGTFLTVKYTVPYLKRQGGSIIVTSSVNGTRIFSNTGATAYSCSKGGQVIFSRMVALELAPHKVRINTVCPGAITTNIGENTEQRNVESVKIPVEFPEGEIPLTGSQPGTIEQVAEAVLFLASDASSHVTGTEIFVDGGQSLLQG